MGRADEQILTEASLAKFHEPIDWKDYGKGWIVTNRKWARGKALTHAGLNTMFYALIWIAPELDFAAVAMCNYGGKDGFRKCYKAIGYLIKKHLK